MLLFATGAFGVLIRRSPLIILLALEIMLNAGNLALLAFSRHAGNGDGQIFALTVMVVAAAEAVVGLGLIVAVSRRHVDLDVDKLTIRAKRQHVGQQSYHRRYRRGVLQDRVHRLSLIFQRQSEVAVQRV